MCRVGGICPRDRKCLVLEEVDVAWLRFGRLRRVRGAFVREGCTDAQLRIHAELKAVLGKGENVFV